MIPFKKYTGEWLSAFREHKLLFLYAAVILAVSFIFSFSQKQLAKRIGVGFSFADCILSSLNGVPLYISVILLPCIALSVIVRHDFSINRAVRYVRLKQLWKKHCWFAVLTSAGVTVYQMLSIAVIGAVLSETLINFDTGQSIFGFMNNGAVLEKPSITAVCVSAAFFCFFMCLLFCFLYLFLKWFIGADSIIFIILILLSALDIYAGFGLCGFAGIFYEKWVNYQFTSLLIPLSGAVLLCLLGYFCADRKDFLHAK